MTLVIMAAGLGSRFGGLKQIEPVGPNGEFIIDYSIYDALYAGFKKVVFIIKKENYDIFKNTIGKRIEDKIEVHYVFQNNDNVPKEYNFPKNRIKPLGTAHAILAVKKVVNEPFLMINADDFYGRDAYLKAIESINKDEKEYSTVLYEIKNTLTQNGSVKRGYSEVKNGYLTNIIESSVINDNGKIKVTPLNGSKEFIVLNNSLVSMNMFIFKPSIFNYLEKYFIEFLNENKNNFESCEYLITDVVEKIMKNEGIKVKVLKTSSKWQGVTYKEDKQELVKYIKNEINNGVYPKNLY